MSDVSPPAPADPSDGDVPDVVGWFAGQADRFRRFILHVGASTLLAQRTLVAMFTGRFEFGQFVYQVEQLGVRSFSIGAATAVFVGIVMAIQFAFSLEKFGAKDSVGRIVALAFVRELGPALTSLVVGSRIAAGMTAEIGSMQVTEQIDAIRALGADPVRKLVVPRMLAGIVIMPLLSAFALVFGIASAMVVCQLSFGISPPFFISSALDAVTMQDLLSGVGKTPFFGFLVTLLGCYFGFHTTGGTEGVGKATTTSVVVVSITVLIADALLTQIFLSL